MGVDAWATGRNDLTPSTVTAFRFVQMALILYCSTERTSHRPARCMLPLNTHTTNRQHQLAIDLLKKADAKFNLSRWPRKLFLISTFTQASDWGTCMLIAPPARKTAGQAHTAQPVV